MTKIFKKMTALLLAGIMTMALLTACGGTPSFSKQVEDVMMQKMGEVFGVTTNDSALRAKAAAALDKINADGKIVAKDAISVSVTENAGGAKATMLVAGDISKLVDGNIKENDLINAIKITPADLEQAKNSTYNKTDIPEGAKIEALGIAAKTMSDGSTYLAYAVTYSYTAS